MGLPDPRFSIVFADFNDSFDLARYVYSTRDAEQMSMSNSRMTSEERSLSVDEAPAERYTALEEDELMNRIRTRANSTGKRLSFVAGETARELFDEPSPGRSRDARALAAGLGEDNRGLRSYSTGERLAPGTFLKSGLDIELNIDPELLKGLSEPMDVVTIDSR